MSRNNFKIFDIMDKPDYDKIKNSTISVIGCGAIGSNILESFARMGILNLIGIDDALISDKDIYNHIIALDNNLYEPKALETKKRLFRVNQNVYFIPKILYINEYNARNELRKNDLVISTVPSIEFNLLLEEVCDELDIPLIIANINKDKSYITTQFPGDYNLESYTDYIDEIYDENFGKIKPPYSIPYISSFIIHETIKILLNKGNNLQNKLLISNMENYETQLVVTSEIDNEDDDDLISEVENSHDNFDIELYASKDKQEIVDSCISKVAKISGDNTIDKIKNSSIDKKLNTENNFAEDRDESDKESIDYYIEH